MKSFVFIIGCLVTLTLAQRRPPNYSQDEMPDTSFDCRDKVVGGYYADIETDCQMFHVCVKVPGLGVQDYRFLCPNDTTFDQENQICANWYDIDCEASTLFYSDNFDLYRIDKGAVPTSKGTPIPLGPSTQRPPAAPAKKRPFVQKQDEEEEFYLQRSETGDRRSQNNKDLLRGSSSGNFFNKNNGKEDDFDDSYQPKETKPVDVPRRRIPNNNPNGNNNNNYPNSNNNNNNKKKVAVRKFRKRPENEFDVNAQQSYQANPTTLPPTGNTQQQNTVTQNNDPNDRYFNRQNNRQSFNNQRTNTQNFNGQNPSSTTFNTNPTTEVPTTRNQQYQPRYNTINRNNNAQTTTTQAPSTFYQAPVSNNNNNNFQSRNNRPGFEAPRGSTNFAKSTTLDYEYVATKVPTTKKYNDNQPRGFEVQKTNIAHSSAGIASTTVSYQNAGFSNGNNNNQQNARDFSKTSFNSVSTTFAPVTYSGNFRQNNNNGQNAFVKVTTQRVSTDFQDYNGNFDSYGNQRGSQNPAAPQSPLTSDEYVESARDVEKEFLKTAPSNNIRPSNFNTFAKTYTDNTAVTNNYNNNNYTNNANNNNNQGFYDQKSTTNYNYDAKNTNTDYNSKTTNYNNFRSQSTQTQYTATNPTTKRPSTQYYQPSSTQYNQFPSSQAQTSPTTYAPPKTAQTFAPVRNSGTKYYQSTSLKPAPTTTVAPYIEDSRAPVLHKRPPPEPRKPAGPVKDASYDYAYYDDTDAGGEYEGTDPISDHHFGKAGESLKISS